MKILVVDDDRSVRDTLRQSLTFNGYDVVQATDGVEAQTLIRKENPDLVIMDGILPKVDGLEILRSLRGSGSEVLVLMLSQKSDVADRVAGLDAGADDYLTKPFALEELLARVRSLYRRSRRTAAAVAKDSKPLSFLDLTLNPETREVTRDERRISLTRTEFALLELLLRNARKVLSRNTILEEVWGYDFPTSGNALEVYIGYLRRKTEAEGEDRLIHTVRGVGYVLRENTP
ncbi:response regulator transcription factor [Corynebacterium variabile]|uniref:response regulator transcription factor n=1 Tax=Corynebacterium variabile TaxID=1727 RepID=UPI00264759C8|nr:response regulator transcription factor [Corynebacterium variabile]MDN6239825.1 response regulator transcription factor [Corynebacterium variabile]MDN6478680.1 response regulator transcription factor [Corynebacterium variabile]MDN6662243.1 response regulator transcription factor [Corynebacterium variabile]MDN6677170.1 response regulator transcription factor [Corynebacterium variabile]